MTLPFGEDREKFESSLFLVLCNRLVTCGVAVICLMVGVACPCLPASSLVTA